MVTDIQHKKITIFAGHYGSGKTNLAVNYALMLREHYKEVMVCDLDIVNPYFRTKDSEQVLSDRGIRLAASLFANSNLDIPAIPPETATAFEKGELYSVFDVGGDDSGAVALGQFARRIEEQPHELLMVINCFRPMTRTPEGAMAHMVEMEQASNLRFTAIVNNSNLGEITSLRDFARGVEFAERLSQLSGLPIKMHTLREDLANTLENLPENLFKIKIYGKSNWKISNKEQEASYGKGHI